MRPAGVDPALRRRRRVHGGSAGARGEWWEGPENADRTPSDRQTDRQRLQLSRADRHADARTRSRREQPNQRDPGRTATELCCFRHSAVSANYLKICMRNMWAFPLRDSWDCCGSVRTLWRVNSPRRPLLNAFGTRCGSEENMASQTGQYSRGRARVS